MYILSFRSPVGVKFKGSIPIKIFITQNDRNHSDFHLGLAVLGSELRVPCYDSDRKNVLIAIIISFERHFNY